ncbi:MAG: DUF5916 domain-containing protein [Balneolaceae bacterium]|nr:DUF5916 domain-containing protein [Balneolaceae bacterium]
MFIYKEILAFVLFFFLGLLPNISFSQQPMEISRIEGPITLDGMPDESAWEKLEPLPLVTYFPEAGNQPTERSDIRIGYTAEYLYLGGKLYDSEPDKIQSPNMERDKGSPADDGFGLCLDTFNDNENTLCFNTHPAGIRDDFAISKDAVPPGHHRQSWNTFWSFEAVQNDDGWFAEIRIPFSSIRYQVKNKDVTMGLIVFRWVARKYESSIFPAIPGDYGFWGHFKASQARDVVFRDMQNHTPFRVAPYLLGGMSQQHLLNDGETTYLREDDLTLDAGLDVKYGITSSLTLDLTLNTDFAQVEADDQQVNLTRFSLFFPEKRTFFQERSNLFNFNFGENNRLFYSRRIGIHEEQEIRILGGARLTGSLGDWDLGAINMQTARLQEVPSENFGVLRLRHDIINDYSYGGAMFTSRVGGDGTYNYGLGLDGVIRLFGDSYLLANAAQTFEDKQKNRPLDVDAMRLRLQLERRNLEGFGYNLEYSRAGNRYNPGVGFELRDDFTKWGNRIFYGWFADENSAVINYEVSMYGSAYLQNVDNTVETARIGLGIDINFKSGAVAGGILGVNYEHLIDNFELINDISIPAGNYHAVGLEAYANTSRSGLFILGSTVNIGEFFDGYRWSASVAPSWSVSSSTKLSGFYQINHLTFPERDDAFTAHIGRLRLEYYFSTELSASTFVQYSNADERIISNFRLRYNPREGNDLYIVYNEGLNTDRFSRTPELPFSNRRTILVKYTYTFNY